MLADTEAKVPVLAVFISAGSVFLTHMQVIAMNVECVGVFERSFISVACTKIKNDTGALRNDIIVHLDLAGGVSKLCMHDGVVSHHLRKGILPQAFIVDHILQLIGSCVHQVIPHVGDGLFCGISTCGEQQGNKSLYFFGCHSAAVHLCNADP